MEIDMDDVPGTDDNTTRMSALHDNVQKMVDSVQSDPGLMRLVHSCHVVHSNVAAAGESEVTRRLEVVREHRERADRIIRDVNASVSRDVDEIVKHNWGGVPSGLIMVVTVFIAVVLFGSLGIGLVRSGVGANNDEVVAEVAVKYSVDMRVNGVLGSAELAVGHPVAVAFVPSSWYDSESESKHMQDVKRAWEHPSYGELRVSGPDDYTLYVRDGASGRMVEYSQAAPVQVAARD